MRTVFKNKEIEGILGVVPETEYHFDDEAGNYDYPIKQTMRLKKVMGFDRHRLAKKASLTSDFAAFGINYLLKKKLINLNEIGAVIVVTLSPDYYLPQVSNILHGMFSFDRGVVCMDIPQGCCGFILGLMQAFMLLEHIGDKKVLLVNADVLCHNVDKKDRDVYPMAGDAATLTVIKNGGNNKIPFELYNDGTRCDALKIAVGGFKFPTSNDYLKYKEEIGDTEHRSHMDGTAVFNFVQSEVPPMLKEAFEYNDYTYDDIDYFLFHQPNRFMLEKLAQKCEIPQEKLFMNLVETYGNTNGATIPMVTALNLTENLIHNKYHCCLSAFGSGLSWGVVFMDIGPLKFCGIIESDL